MASCPVRLTPGASLTIGKRASGFETSLSAEAADDSSGTMIPTSNMQVNTFLNMSLPPFLDQLVLLLEFQSRLVAGCEVIGNLQVVHVENLVGRHVLAHDDPRGGCVVLASIETGRRGVDIRHWAHHVPHFVRDDLFDVSHHDGVSAENRR